MTRFNWLDWTASVALIVGGLFLGLAGLFGFSVFTIFGVTLGRILFILVGISALYTIFALTKISEMERMAAPKEHIRRKAA